MHYNYLIYVVPPTGGEEYKLCLVCNILFHFIALQIQAVSSSYCSEKHQIYALHMASPHTHIVYRI